MTKKEDSEPRTWVGAISIKKAPAGFSFSGGAFWGQKMGLKKAPFLHIVVGFLGGPGEAQKQLSGPKSGGKRPERGSLRGPRGDISRLWGLKEAVGNEFVEDLRYVLVGLGLLCVWRVIWFQNGSRCVVSHRTCKL